MSFTEAVTGSKLKRNRWYLDTIQATAHSMFFSWLSKLSHLCNLHKHLKIANARSNFQQIKNRRRAGLALKRGCFHFLRKELYSNLAERHIDSMQVSPNQSLENKNTNSCVRSRLGEPQHFLSQRAVCSYRHIFMAGSKTEELSSFFCDFARTAQLCTVRVEMQVKHIKVQPEAAKHITAAISKYRLKHRPFFTKTKNSLFGFFDLTKCWTQNQNWFVSAFAPLGNLTQELEALPEWTSLTLHTALSFCTIFTFSIKVKAITIK